jgi:hypothetical protein
VETTTVIANQIKPTPNIKNILTVIDMKINTTAETPEEASPQIPETIARMKSPTKAKKVTTNFL